MGEDTMTDDREVARQSFGEHAWLSWEEYQRTGLHITLEELEAWMDSWGAPGEKELPACHT